jgi:hypothetical protein
MADHQEDFVAYSSCQISASSESKSQRRAMQFPQQPDTIINQNVHLFGCMYVTVHTACTPYKCSQNEHTDGWLTDLGYY